MKHILKEDKNYTVYVISDIHGHYELFLKTLNKLTLKEDDYLIILGDFINKGPNSYETYLKMKEISKRERTIVLKGNHELHVEYYMENKDKSDELLSFIKGNHYETIVDSYLRTNNINPFTIKDGLELTHHLEEFSSEYLDFSRSLPIIIEFDKHLFVHGGHEDYMNVWDNEVDLLKYDHYIEKSSVNEKTVVVGHWPTCNLRSDNYDNRPHFHHEKNIISVDGGLGVKRAGELNVLCITLKDDEIDYHNIQVNNFDSYQVVENIKFPEEELYLINYPHYEIEILEEGLELSKCRHIQTGKVLSVINELISEDRKYVNATYINHFLNLNPDDEVLLIRDAGTFSFVKHKEHFGWVYTKQLNI